MKAYCFKCRAKREMENPSPHLSKNGQTYIRGTCGKCNTNMSEFVSKSDIKKGGFLSSLFSAIGLGMQLPGTQQARGLKKKRKRGVGVRLPGT